MWREQGDVGGHAAIIYYNCLGVVEFTVYFLLKSTWSTRAIAEHFIEIMK